MQPPEHAKRGKAAFRYLWMEMTCEYYFILKSTGRAISNLLKFDNVIVIM